MKKHLGVTPDLEAIIDNRNRKEYRTESAAEYISEKRIGGTGRKNSQCDSGE